MKFACYFYVIIICVLACTSKQKQSNTTGTDSLVNAPGSTADSAFSEGARLIAANDCLTCHKMDEKSICPSYNEISAQYQFKEGNIENLAYSIIHGSKGLWGNQAMTPHPNVSYNDAKEMTRYILSLKMRPSQETAK